MPRLARSGAFVLLMLFATLPALASAQPVLSVSPTAVNAQGFAGTNVSSQTVQVRNAGKRALKWSVVAPTASWVSVSPMNGTNAGNLTLSFNTSALPAGVYSTAFAVRANTGASIVVTVGIQIDAATALPPPPPPPPPATLTVTCPANKTVASSDGSAVAVTYSATTSGGVAPVSVTYDPASGSAFPVATTPVSVTARSSDGQTATCGFTVAVTYSAPAPPPPPPPPAPSSVGPQSTITCPAGAVDVWPGQSIPSTVNSYAGATTFCLRAGVHYLTSAIRPKTGNTFVGEYGAILDGSNWSTTDDTQGAFRAHNEDIDYVTIRNLVIRRMPQSGIHTYYWMSNHWTIEYNEIAYNKIGIEFSPNFLVRNNYIHHNVGISPSSTNPAERGGGYQGFRSDNTTFEGNEIAYNGREQKVGLSANVTFRNNFVHHNLGDGIWYDTNHNAGALIEGNRVEDNGRNGIFFEASAGATIRNNTIRRHAWDALILSMSQSVQIYNNVLEGNYGGIAFFLNCESLALGEDVTNNAAYDNTVVVGTQSYAYAAGFSHLAQCTSTQLAPYLNGSKNLTFSRNTYRVPSLSGRYLLWGSWKYWYEWQNMGQDAGGSLSQ